MGEYDKQRRYSAKKAMLSSDIHPIPKILDRPRRDACEHDLKRFLETYCKEAFPLDWAEFHLEVIHGLEEQIRTGGSLAVALPRGSGKTTLLVRAALWAILYGHTPYAYIIAADTKKANNLLSGIKKILRFNQLLFEDFPEVCHPIRELQGLAINALKQHCDGEYTLINWKDGALQLPTVEGSKCSGALIEVGGVTAAARGAQVVMPDGKILRPSLILIDDFQTRESAASHMQCKTRLSIIAGDLAGMKGPDQPLAMLAAITVVYKGDAADQLLDRDLNPEWRGIRHRMVRKWPSNAEMWETYAELRLAAIRAEKTPDDAEDFYKDNFEAMNLGGEVSWEARKENDRTAIQHAYNLRLRIGEEAFNAEYQNDPDDPSELTVKFLTAEEIAAKVNGRPKGAMSEEISKITAAVDVQNNHLWWGIVGWDETFGGTVLDYGTWPGARRRWFTKRSIPHHFGNTAEYAGMGEEAAIFHAINTLLENLMAREWVTDAGTALSLSRVLIDEGYQTTTVHKAIRSFGQLSQVSPAKGIGIKAGTKPMMEWVRRKGEPRPRHDHWRHRLTKSADRNVRTTQWDSYYWRTLLHHRILAKPGDPGCLELWGKNTVQHRLLGAHLTSYNPSVQEGVGSKEIIEWTPKPLRPDHDLFDVFAMAAVAASELGITLPGEKPKPSDHAAVASGSRMTLAEYIQSRKK